MVICPRATTVPACLKRLHLYLVFPQVFLNLLCPNLSGFLQTLHRAEAKDTQDIERLDYLYVYKPLDYF